MGTEQGTSIYTEVSSSRAVGDLLFEGVEENLHVQIKYMLTEHAEMWDVRLGKIRVTEHKLDLSQDAVPVRQNPYNLGYKELEFSKQQIDKMFKTGVVEPSASEWSSPIVLVPKADGSLRLFVDYRRLNAVTKFDSYLLPSMDDCVNSLGHAKL